jgi:broad specificity phosphatase PhoE
VRIILARHGRPAWDFRTPVRGHAFGDWRRGEDDAPLDPTYPPPAALRAFMRGATSVFTSPLRRSRESAARLAPGVATLVDADFREAELPCGFRSGLRLWPGMWGLVARSAWCCGWSAGVETFAAARQRAAKAAALLRARAARDGLVVLVGHGFLNILIARHLRAAGWRGPPLPSQAHWGFAIYAR